MKDENPISVYLLSLIRDFPTKREVSHCGNVFSASPLDIYWTCPSCGIQIKLRGMAAGAEIEDVFDALIEWLNDSEARAIFEKRQREILEDVD